MVQDDTGTERAPAKVNLSLRVTGRRADGYHLLDSVVVFAGIGDALRAEPADALRLRVVGPHAGSLAAEPDNLVLRAARALAAETGVTAGADLILDKQLPVASGIGGGSADAAAALRLLTRFWAVDIADRDLDRLAAGLGADVPVCLHGRPARMRGIGDRLDPLPGAFPTAGLVLVNPGVAVSTQAVFRAMPGQFAPEAAPEAWADLPALIRWLHQAPNDLQEPAAALCPAIADVLRSLREQSDCLIARMSGSGATCYALFPDIPQARAAAAALSRPGWWCWGGALAR